MQRRAVSNIRGSEQKHKWRPQIWAQPLCSATVLSCTTKSLSHRCVNIPTHSSTDDPAPCQQQSLISPSIPRSGHTIQLREAGSGLFGEEILGPREQDPHVPVTGLTDASKAREAQREVAQV